ncbi:TetR/AcrR family transcriptional regulator [Streptomyces sp. NPDC088674]|uniref:TetR/AcrR family transcriptional regulator n=1 Tax=Streptomyces sp. NPDC088674 TaxID=3365869 RepID=UPI0037FD84A7
MTGQRADARRNYARILAVAEAEVAERGADASLEHIARTAGVGSATVRRHFPNRRALLEAVFHERIEALRVRAEALTEAEDSRAALLTWLHELVAYSVSARGFADTLTYEPPSDTPSSCATALEDSGAPLLRRAQRDGAVAAGITPHDLLTLGIGIALATEHHEDPEAQAERLFAVVVEGVSPGGGWG